MQNLEQDQSGKTNKGNRKTDLGFLVGFLVGAVSIAGCAAVKFPYKYYKPDLKVWDGQLLGAKPSDDLNAETCAPDEKEDGKCVLMLRKPFFDMKADYLNCKQELIKCQQNCQ